MTAETSMPTANAELTRAELCALRQLRNRYGQDRDLFSAQELAQLRFYRWLYGTGRFLPHSPL